MKILGAGGQMILQKRLTGNVPEIAELGHGLEWEYRV